MFIFSNLAITADGKIDTKKRSGYKLGSKEDRREMDRLRAKADAVLLGAGSVRSYPKAVPGLLNVLVTTKLQGLRPSMDYFKNPRAHTVIFLGGKVSEKRLDGFRKHCDIYRLSGGPAGVKKMLQILKKYGVKNLLVEGGGEVMWMFVRDNLIDEYHVTVTPRILGGKAAPTMVDGDGFLPKKDVRLKLKSCRKKGGELFLIYTRG